jgi:hypothetical protein
MQQCIDEVSTRLGIEDSSSTLEIVDESFAFRDFDGNEQLNRCRIILRIFHNKNKSKFTVCETSKIEFLSLLDDQVFCQISTAFTICIFQALKNSRVILFIS